MVRFAADDDADDDRDGDTGSAIAFVVTFSPGATLEALLPMPLVLPVPLPLPLPLLPLPLPLPLPPTDRVMAMIDDAISLAAISASKADLMMEPTVGVAEESEVAADRVASADARAAASAAFGAALEPASGV